MGQPLSDVANVQVSTTGGGLSLPGFGVPLILGAYLKTWAERIRYYTSLAGVAVDFAVTSAEYLAASALFGQTPHPTRIAIGRGTRIPAQAFKIYVPAAGLPVLAPLTLNIAGVAVTFTTDATPLQSEVAIGLAAAINAGTATHHLVAVADVSNAFITVTNNVAGGWTRVELVNPAPGVIVLTTEVTTPDPGVEADLNEIAIQNPDFYAVTGYAYLSSAIAVRLAVWAGANARIFIGQTTDTAVIAAADAGAVDVGHVLKVAAYPRASIWYDPDNGAFLDASIAGRCLPEDAGSETWALKTLAGVTARDYTATHLVNMIAKCVNWYNAIAGRNVTSPDSGKVSANEWIDTVRGIDSLTVDMEAAIFLRMANATKKIPYTDKGATVIAAEVAAVLKAYEDRGFIVQGSSSVTVPTAASQSQQNQDARSFAGISFNGEIAGAIHKMTVNGVLV